jgi:hypothetical protein
MRSTLNAPGHTNSLNEQIAFCWPNDFSKGYTYGLLLKSETVSEACRAHTLPTLYVIGADGKIIYREIGLSAEKLAAVIEQHLKEARK